MIRTLHIENYALIGQLDMDWPAGFSVITGETGAGKSIILGALGLLTGERADARAVKNGERRCVVEAEWDVQGIGLDDFFNRYELDFDGQSVCVRRELTAAGKSRAFVNDTPVQLSVLRELASRIVDIHSQHQNLLIGKEDFQVSVLDTLAGDEVLLLSYMDTYKAWRTQEKLLREAEAEAQRQKEEEDYLRFQYSQLTEAHLEEGEQERLEAEASVLTHAEDIRQALSQGAQLLAEDTPAGGLGTLREARKELLSVAANFPPATELAERMEQCYIELKDVTEEMERQAERTECSPARLEAVNDRLSLIYSLQQKHHLSTVGELLQLQQSLEQQLSRIDSADERLDQLRRQCTSLHQQALEGAQALSAQRIKAGERLHERMEELLRPLGMPYARFTVELVSDPNNLTELGSDKVTFLLSANKNQPLQDIGRVASGGEMARVMLCLKSLLHGHTHLPTIIFDEIDAGVSGQIAEKMARLMSQMAEGGRQVVSITHLPQIAAVAPAHFKVYKEDSADTTSSHIRRLTPAERVEEIAHMLSGETLTEAAMENARELITHHA